jgi:sugar O-acyltransferase (sialic acid O-acetyltransferase NeuD family)
MVEGIVIFGAGETAELAYEYFTVDSKYKVVAFAVDKEYRQHDRLYGLPVIDLQELTNVYQPSQYKAFVAISASKLNRTRRDLYLKAKSLGYSLVSYVSSRSFMWRNVEIGDNCFVLENNVLQPFTKLGNNVTLWSGNHIGHRTVIGDHTFVSSHCVISGFCNIGNSSFLGVNCTIEDNVVLASDNFIGAGALIQKDTEHNSLFQNKQTELSRVDTHRLFKVK